MYCRHCGKKIADISKFCQYCGQSVGIIETNTEKKTVLPVNTVINNSDSMMSKKSFLKKFETNCKYWIFAGCGAFALILVIVILFFGGNDNVSKKVESLLEKDLNTSVKITELYYNEEIQGCFVEFTAKGSYDEAAVHLDTEDIDYKSEFEYYSEKAEKLRAQVPIDEQKLHECNLMILNSSYPDWNFTKVVMEANGETGRNGWEKIK